MSDNKYYFSSASSCKPRKSIFFHHIPKTAGTTLIGILNQHFDLWQILPKGYFCVPARDVREADVRAASSDLHNFKLIHGHFPIPLFNFLGKDYYRLTLLREPVSRVISLYNDWLNKSEESLRNASPDDIQTVKRARKKPLIKFLKDSRHPIPALFDNGQVRLLAGAMDIPVLGQEHLQRAMYTLDQLDLVGVSEFFESFLTMLCWQMGWDRPERFQSLNIYSRKHSFNRLGSKERKIIKQRTALDQKLYRYALSRFDQDLSDLVLKLGGHSKLNPRHQWAKPAPATEVRFNMEQGFEGTGWHVREGVGTGQVWRWTGPGRLSSIRFRLEPGLAYKLQLKVISVIHQPILDDMDLFLNYSPLSWKHRGIQNGEQVIEATVPAQYVTEADNVLVIEVPYTISHAEVQPETADPRQKGVAVTEINIQAED